MTTPDNEMIAQVMLLSEGYRYGKDLGTKIVSVLEMCRQLLSEQQHYDWGLRALKSILRLAGTIMQERRRYAATNGVDIDKPEEMAFVVESLRVNSLPKLTAADTSLFRDLLHDVFPLASVESDFKESLKVKLRAKCGTLGLVAIEPQLDKAVQLHEALRQRMGVVVVGQAGSGKSTIIKLLRETLATDLALKVHILNPKAMSRKT